VPEKAADDGWRNVAQVKSTQIYKDPRPVPLRVWIPCTAAAVSDNSLQLLLIPQVIVQGDGAGFNFTNGNVAAATGGGFNFAEQDSIAGYASVHHDACALLAPCCLLLPCLCCLPLRGSLLLLRTPPLGRPYSCY